MCERQNDACSNICHAGHFSNVTLFNAFLSHNVAYNCHYATFNVDFCYDILQQLLLICMSTKASVIIQAINHPTLSKHRNILQLLTNKYIL